MSFNTFYCKAINKSKTFNNQFERMRMGTFIICNESGAYITILIRPT